MAIFILLVICLGQKSKTGATKAVALQKSLYICKKIMK